MTFLRFLLECRIRNDAQVGVLRGQLPLYELFGVPLDPSQQFIQLPHTLHFRVIISPLECYDEHHHIDPCVGRIRDRSQQGDEEAV